MTDRCCNVTIVRAVDCKFAGGISSILTEKFKEYDGINIVVNNKLFKDFKKIENIILDNNFHIFIVSSYLNGKKCRSIRRFQRKLDNYSNELNKLLFCIISLNDAENESNKMYLCLKNKRKSIEFYDNIIINNEKLIECNDILLSINKYLNKMPKQQKMKIKEKEKEKIKEVEKEKEYDFTICYGTMTGNAKEISNEIVSIALSKNNKYLINGPIPLNKFTICETNKKIYLIIVVSTTGDGEIPLNAQIFYRKLKIKCLNIENKYKYSNIYYAILGLGDSNYSQFNLAAKNIDKLLSFLSPNKFYHTGYADDGIGLEDVVEPWKYGVINNMNNMNNTCSTNNIIQVKNNNKLFNYTNNEYNLNIIYNFNIIQVKNNNNKKHKIKPCNSRYELFKSKYNQNQKYKSSYKAYDCNNQFFVSLLSSKYETSFEENGYIDTIIINLTFKLPNGYSYEIGDILCIYSPNPEYIVNKLLNRLSFNGNDIIYINTISEKQSNIPYNLKHLPFKKEITIYDIFRFCIDIRTIPKSKLFLKSLSKFCKNINDKNKLLNLKQIPKYTLIELFNEYKSCYPTLKCLLHFLFELKPRQYSICSSPNKHCDQIDICFRVITNGICSNWLYSLCVKSKLISKSIPITQYINLNNTQNFKIPIYLTLSPNFKPPTHLKQNNLILIGPGTGVSIFRAFLQHLYYTKYYNNNNKNQICNGSWRGIDMLFNDENNDEKLNDSLTDSHIQSKCILFFGCRHPNKDYLFKNDWKQFLENGVLNNLFVAFSRYYDNKIYVQHLLKKNSLLISNLILNNNNTYIFVCGDASKMAKDVENTIIELIALHSKMSLIESTKYIQNMKLSNRYNVDVWNSMIN